MASYGGLRDSVEQMIRLAQKPLSSTNTPMLKSVTRSSYNSISNIEQQQQLSAMSDLITQQQHLFSSSALNGGGGVGGGQLSPLRRSTRRSAQRATERIRGEHSTNMNGGGGQYDSEDGYGEEDEYESANMPDGDAQDAAAPARTTPRQVVDDNVVLDQFDSHFAVQLNDADQVEMLSEDSSESDIEEAERVRMRKQFDLLTKAEPTGEQRHARKRMIDQLKSTLRIEEANLLMLKKLRESQQQSQAAAVSTNTNASSTQRGHATGGNTTNRSTNNTQQTKQSANTAQLSQHKLAAHIADQQRSNLAAVMMQQVQQQNTRTPPAAHSSGMGRTPSASVLQPPPAHQLKSSALPPAPIVDAAQRQLQAKVALRKQLEKNLLLIAPPTPPPADVHFVPNSNQLEFVTLHGLDQVVQRVLRDKTVTAPQLPDTPWVCTQCDTDFTPHWHAESTGDDDANEGYATLFCDACYRSNQKKAVRNDQTAKFKKEFLLALKREQDIETMKDGNIDWARLGLPVPPAPPAAATQAPATQTQMTSSRSSSHLPSMASTSNGGNYALSMNKHANTGYSSNKQQNSSAAAAAAALRTASQHQAAAHPMMAAAAAALQHSTTAAQLMNNQMMASLAASWQQQQQRNAAALNPLAGLTAMQQQQMAMLLAAASAGSGGGGTSSGTTPGSLLNNIPKEMLHTALQQRLFESLMPKQANKWS